jgi:cell wall-associated NlpC family hydrolase
MEGLQMERRKTKWFVSAFWAVLLVLLVANGHSLTNMSSKANAMTATAGDAEVQTAGDDDEYFTGIKITDGMPYAYWYGDLITAQGWEYLDNYYDADITVYVDEDGYAMSYVDENWILYDFNAATGEFDMCKDVWWEVDGSIYYFGTDGVAAKKYANGKCYDLSSGYIEYFSDTVELFSLDGGTARYYYIGSYGNINTDKSTWFYVDSNLYVYNSAAGYVTIRLIYTDGYWQYQTYNYSTGVWSNYKKSGWRYIDYTSYYFNANGIATRYSDGYNCYNLTQGKETQLKSTVALISLYGKTARYYYLDEDGDICTYTSQWIKVNNYLYVYNSAAGYVTIRLIYTGGYWQYQTYNYSTGVWSNYKKKGWRYIDEKYFYFTASGVATRYYNGYYCFNLTKSKATLVKNTFALVGTDYMYFTSNGKVAETGVYKNAGSSIYTCNGIILFWKKYVSGKYYNYRYDIFTHKFVYDNSVGVRASETAMEHLRLTYKWGGENLDTGVDCSGLLVASYKKYGVYLPHSSKILMSYGKSVKNNYKYWKPGDIMARDGHARMYVGNGCVIQTMSGIGVWVTSGWTEVEDNYVVRRTP